jgi:hypothetical protein
MIVKVGLTVFVVALVAAAVIVAVEVSPHRHRSSAHQGSVKPSTSAAALPAVSGSYQPHGIPGTWRLVLDSEFDGSTLPTYWRSGWFGTGETSPVNPGNGDCNSTSNVTFPGDGTLHLNVTDVSSTCSGVTTPFTGAVVTTDPDDGRRGPGFSYAYGVLEARVYIPALNSAIADWPAVWTDGQHWPTDGEDDIFEALDGEACYHFRNPSSNRGGCDTAVGPGWHTFASDWEPGSVTYYYDGVEVGSVTSGITSAAMYIVLDNTTRANTGIGDSFRIQYVRVWQS